MMTTNNLARIGEPRFTRQGSYKVESDADRLRAAVAALRSVLACRTAYHAQGPQAVVENMAHAAGHALAVIDGLTFTRQRGEGGR